MEWFFTPRRSGRRARQFGLDLSHAIAVAVLLLGLLVGLVPSVSAADDEDESPTRHGYPVRTIIALTASNQLLGFDPLRPERIRFRTAVTNLKPGERLVGIDFRPLTGRLYGIGSTSQVYVIDISSGFASPIGAPFTPALEGTEFGVDFNPVPDRIRVVSDTGQNLRINPDTGAALTDGRLAFATGDANAGKTPNVVGAAYTNNVARATTTTLYDIDSGLDLLTTQNPPNAGTLNTVGPLRVDAGDLLGFDIASGDSRLSRILRRRFDSPGADTALAVFQVAGSGPSRLFSIDLATGKATGRGAIGGGELIRGLAIPVEDPDLERVYTLTAANELLGFDPQRPERIRSRVAIAGLQPGERLVGIDFRPATGVLYGIGSTSRVYTIDTKTGAAVAIGTPFTPALEGTEFGVDFNPVVDRIRVVSNTGQNLRLNPDTGAALTDGRLAFATGDANAGKTPNVVGAGYTNNFPGATATTLYDVDSGVDVLTTQNPPNAGTLNTVGPLRVDAGDLLGFDIASRDDKFNKRMESQGSDTALAAFQVAGSGRSRLYSINLATGRARDRGVIGSGEPVRGLAISPDANDD